MSEQQTAENDALCSYTTSAADYCHKHGGHLADADGRCDAV